MSDTIQILKSGTCALSGLASHQHEYISKRFQGLNLKKMQVFTIVNNNAAYVVTFGAEESQYQKYLEDVENLINLSGLTQV